MQNPLLTTSAVMEFKKDDSITIQIMANAASIVPKACDILGISLSDSESEEDSDDSRTAEITGDRCPKSQQIATRLRESGEVNNEDFSINNNNNAEVQLVQDARPKPKLNRAREGNRVEGSLRGPNNDKGTGESESQATAVTLGRTEELLRKSRKRCASTPSNLGQSSSQGTSSREGNSNPPKRRFPSISSATASLAGSSFDATASTISTNNISTSSAAATRSAPFANPASGVPNLSSDDAAIRRKMLADLEIFHKQMTELAAVEKTKVHLLKKFIHISNSLNKLREERLVGRQTPTEALQVVHEAGMDEGEDAAELFHGTNSTTSNNLSSNTASSVNQIEITFDEGSSFNESSLDRPYDQQIFTEADLSLGAEETVVIDGEVIQDSEDVVGGLF